MAVSMTVSEYLSDHGVPFAEMIHKPSKTALTSADAANISGDFLAKAVLCRDKDGYILAVIPATHTLELNSLGKHFHSRVALATEGEIDGLFYDCASGAVPVTGQAYGIKVVWDDVLADRAAVFFEGGDHETLVEVEHYGFDRMMKGSEHGHFSHHI